MIDHDSFGLQRLVRYGCQHDLAFYLLDLNTSDAKTQWKIFFIWVMAITLATYCTDIPHCISVTQLIRRGSMMLKLTRSWPTLAVMPGKEQNQVLRRWCLFQWSSWSITAHSFRDANNLQSVCVHMYKSVLPSGTGLRGVRERQPFIDESLLPPKTESCNHWSSRQLYWRMLTFSLETTTSNWLASSTSSPVNSR